MDLENTLLKVIDNRIDVAIKEKIKFDKTYNGKVISIDGKKCVVNIGGSKYNAKIRSGLDVLVDDVVVLKAPNGNFSFLYVDCKLGEVTTAKTEIPFPYNIDYVDVSTTEKSTIEKINNCCVVTLNVSKTSGNFTDGYIGTIPSGFRPTKIIPFVGNLYGKGFCLGKIYTDGRVRIFYTSETGSTIYIAIPMYFTE